MILQTLVAKVLLIQQGTVHTHTWTPRGYFFPRGAGKGSETCEISPSLEPLLTPQPKPQGFVQLQPEVPGTGSGEKQVRCVIKHTYLMNDMKQRPASQNQFPGSVSSHAVRATRNTPPISGPWITTLRILPRGIQASNAVWCAHRLDPTGLSLGAKVPPRNGVSPAHQTQASQGAETASQV